MNKIKKLSKKELKLLTEEEEIPHERKKVVIGIFLFLLFAIIIFVAMIYSTLFLGFRPEFLPLAIIFLIIFVSMFIYLIKEVKLKRQLVFIKLNDSITKPSFSSFLFKQNKVFIKFSQIRYFQYIRNNNGVCTGIQITTNDNRIIKYKKKYLEGRIFKIDLILKYHNIRLNKKPA